MRRPTRRPSEDSALVLRPRAPRDPLPEWRPITPPEGWTPHAVAEAARDYALAIGYTNPRRIAGFAYRALLNALPREVRFEETRLRMEDDVEPWRLFDTLPRS